MVIFGHSGNKDMDCKYDTVDEGDLLNADDIFFSYLETVDQILTKQQKNTLPKKG